MSQFRARAGTYAASAMTSTYAIQSYPTQTDQQNYPWLVASPSEMFRPYDAITRGGLSGLRRQIGKWNGAWYFAALTPLMFNYVQQTLFPTDGINELMTIVTYTARQGWVCLNLYGHLNEPQEFGQTRPRGLLLTDVKLIDFDEGVVVGYLGGDFSADFNADFDRGGIPA